VPRTISIVKPTRCTCFSNLFYFVLALYMFRTVFPSIIGSLRLYIQHQVYVKPSETCRVLLQNKFEKQVHLVGFTIEIYHDARPYKRQICQVTVHRSFQTSTCMCYNKNYQQMRLFVLCLYFLFPVFSLHVSGLHGPNHQGYFKLLLLCYHLVHAVLCWSSACVSGLVCGGDFGVLVHRSHHHRPVR